ncbi:hypothetical protein RUM44_001815 [Polyplax serrata]|uniref:Uncharacterized protein n=1 Tax=Polyplax serrata TaxID=468196 RepID=A0ABR1AMW5_POLSC
MKRFTSLAEFGKRSSSPLTTPSGERTSATLNSSVASNSSEDEDCNPDENAEDDVESSAGSIVDVERDGESRSPTPSDITNHLIQSRKLEIGSARFMLGEPTPVPPVRPTPFSALAAAAAAYSAGLQQHSAPGPWAALSHYPGALFPTAGLPPGAFGGGLTGSSGKDYL